MVFLFQILNNHIFITVAHVFRDLFPSYTILIEITKTKLIINYYKQFIGFQFLMVVNKNIGFWFFAQVHFNYIYTLWWANKVIQVDTLINVIFQIYIYAFWKYPNEQSGKNAQNVNNGKQTFNNNGTVSDMLDAMNGISHGYSSNHVTRVTPIQPLKTHVFKIPSDYISI